MWATRALAFVLLTCLIGCNGTTTSQAFSPAHPEVVEAQTHFTYKGKTIPPYFLADFYGGPDAGDVWTKGMGTRICAVAVEGLFDQSDGSYGGCTFEECEGEDRFVRFDLPRGGDAAIDAGWAAYCFLGTTPSGVTVLQCVINTGGTGTLPGVMFVRFEMETIGYTQADRRQWLVMRFLGADGWGDRVYRDAKLVGSELRLGPERSPIQQGTPLGPAAAIQLK